MADAAEAKADWRDDPSSDERWNAGLDFAMLQLCAALGVDADSISFDAATETLDGDVQSVMWRILQARFGEDFPAPSPSPAGDEVQRAIAEELDRAEKVLDYAGYSRLASAVFKAAALLVQLSEQNAALTALETSWEQTRLALATLRNEYGELRSNAEASRALLAEAVGVVERGRRVLAMMIDPNTIAGTSTQHAWAQCVEAEAAARELVTKLRSSAS